MKNYTGNSSRRMLGGAGSFVGPPLSSQHNAVVNFLKSILPQFQKSIESTEIANENALNGRLSRFITSAASKEFFFAEREIMEDETKGNSPAIDIGIYLKVTDSPIDPPLITAFEGKRLSTDLQKKRRREYVIGHEENGKHINCGGIERFKLGLHGKKLNNAGIIGYLQTDIPDHWQKQINAWILDLSGQSFQLPWSKSEQLTQHDNLGRVIEYISTVNRADSELRLTHLWIDLT